MMNRILGIRILSIALVIVALIGCQGDSESSNEPIEKDKADSFFSSNPESFFLENDTLISNTHCGNLEKLILINDSTYIKTWGNESVSVVLDTVKDGFVSEYVTIWETDNMMGLELNCGSYCWSNRIVRLEHSPQLFDCSYAAIDTACMNIVEIVSDTFRIVNIVNLDTILIGNNYYQYRDDGYPIFHTEIKEFDGSHLIYQVTDDEGNIHIDTISQFFNCSEDQYNCFKG